MIRVCWLSSCIFSDEPIRETGTWLRPLADALVHSGEVELFNITRDFNARKERQQTTSGIQQWILPNYRYGKGLLLDHEPEVVCKRIQVILDEIKPDIVHIWGTEFKWTSVYTSGHIHYPTFVDMQGIPSYYAKVYYGNLEGKELKQVAWDWRDIRHWRQSHRYIQWEMRRRGQTERKHLPLFKHISVQSHYVEECIKCIAPKSDLLHTGIILRPEFYRAAGSWVQVGHPVIFTCAGTFNLPYKGLHVLLQAIGQLKIQYPDIELRIGGSKMNLTHPTDGYTRHIARQIKDMELASNIKWLGPLDAASIVGQMRQCQLCIVPSFIETYCLAMAEAMIVGLPCVASNEAALSELAVDGEEALYYSPGDVNTLVRQVVKLLEEPALAERISRQGTKRRLIDNHPNSVLQLQLNNYRRLITESDNKNNHPNA